MKKYIHLDYGHGYNITGCASPDGRLQEWKWVRQYGQMLHEALLAEGYEVFLTAPDDREPTHAVRCRKSNDFYKKNKGKHIFVSLHVNAFAGAWNNASGWMVLVGNKSGDKSKKLAKSLCKYALEADIMGNRSIPPSMYWEQNLYVCNNTICPAVLIEHGFATNKDDVERMLSLEGRHQLIDITIKAINEYYQTI